jgi:hypothetical protein
MATAVAAASAWVRRYGIATTRRFALTYAAALGAFTLVMVNWRMYAWIAATGKAREAVIREKLPRWELNLMPLVLWGTIVGWMAVSMDGAKRRDR